MKTKTTKRISASAKPGNIIAMRAPVAFEAESPEAKGPRRFDVTAYTGKPMILAGFDLPVVVDLQGMEPGKSLVANLDHDRQKRVGHVPEYQNDGAKLQLGGYASAATEARKEVIESAAEGFVWQASIEATAKKIERIPKGRTVTVNGQSHVGPLYVARTSTLTGFAFVSHGADDDTIVSIAATAAPQRNQNMNVELKAWIEEQGFNPDELNDKQVSVLEASFTAARSNNTQPATGFDSAIDAQKREMDRVKNIQQLTLKAMQMNPQATEAIEAIGRQAIEQSWTSEKFELEFYRASRPTMNAFAPRARAQANNRVLEAALCLTGSMEKPERYFDEQTLDAADRQFRHGLGIGEILLMAARENGSGQLSTHDVQSLLEYAFPPRQLRASSMSTIDLPGILSNVANKFLRDGFMAVDQSWRKIAALGNHRNFMEHTTYSLTGDLQYKKVGPSGEIKHGSLGETTYGNKVETYAKILGITRHDIVNDNTGAITKAPRILGRGGALKFNVEFWTEFLAGHATFFPTDGSKNNYFEGSGTFLQSSSLKTAVQKFRDQTDPDGAPVGAEPKYLVVCSADESVADELYKSTHVNTGGSSSTTRVPNRNTYEGKYEPVVSPYLNSASIANSSATAWFLVADPNDLPFIEAAFLNGKDVPTVETADAEFDIMGIRLRGYHDFGVRKQEYRAAVKSKGAA